ncbi:hypothetical protein GMB86_01005 [Terrilactibacillus sp. BCM23-1]|uniref:Uncharacterized protein n=1 Tax=Terrilactibacillus tamarindi TaxID=2599694 RepID=A0A6N8CNC1_9BACI|nr:hypothetical protein [Terrilactibacillus tamarindi]MTT30593.1 hypothetical protein [Terrilactibacillus tamarindi]
MSEEKHKPKTIHVDTLRIVADKVIIEHKSDQPSHHEPHSSRVDNEEPIMRDFWGFPIPRYESHHEAETESDESSSKKQ